MNRTKRVKRLRRRLGPRVEDLRDQLEGAGHRTDRARAAYEAARREAFCSCTACAKWRRSQTFTARRYCGIVAEETREAWEAAKAAEAAISRELHVLENVHAWACEAYRFARLRRDDPIAWRDAV